MKRFIALVLAVVMVFALAACGAQPAEKLVIVKNIVSVKEFEEKLADYFNKQE